jgi:hypothetical protein
MLQVNGTATIIQTTAGGAVINRPVLGASGDVTVSLQSKFMDLGDAFDPANGVAFKDKFVDGIIMEVDQLLTTNFQAYIGTKGRLTDAPVWTGPFTLDVGAQFIHCRPPEARYIAFKLEDLLPTVSWKITAIELFGTVIGGRQ